MGPESEGWLVAWLHLTNACTCNCAYCYLPRSAEAMTPEVGQRAVEAVFRSARRHCFSGVKLKYAGGEPTLQFPAIVDLQNQARRLAKQYNLRLDAVILTNGLGISPQMIESMQLLDIRLAISLDGLGKWHDQQRPRVDGQGSFVAIEQSIELLLQYGLFPDISVTVTGRNLAGLPLLAQWLLDHDLPFRIEFYRETGSSIGVDGLAFEEQALIHTMRTVFRLIEVHLPRRSLLASLLDRVDLSAPHLYPCAAGRNYLVIDARGRIAKCQMAMQAAVTHVDDTDPLGSVRADKTGIQNPSTDEKEGCQDCRWRYWCAGGCPLVTHRATGRYDVPSPHCHIYQALCPDVIRLEGLRLLKYREENQIGVAGRANGADTGGASLDPSR